MGVHEIALPTLTKLYNINVAAIHWLFPCDMWLRFSGRGGGHVSVVNQVLFSQEI